MPPKKSFENPLIPHIRMRALYRALVETRVLGEKLGRTQRLPPQLEAPWVATAIDLHPEDLVFDRRGPALAGYVRSIGRRAASGTARPSHLRTLLDSPKPITLSATERILCATGAAMAMKAAVSRSVAVASIEATDLSPADWKRLLPLLSAGDLPLVLVSAAAPSGLRSSAGFVVIPVEAADPVAIYRVAQETLLRARAEGGAVLIECVATAGDPIAILAKQLQAKGIATPNWIRNVETQFRDLLARL